MGGILTVISIIGFPLVTLFGMAITYRAGHRAGIEDGSEERDMLRNSMGRLQRELFSLKDLTSNSQGTILGYHAHTQGDEDDAISTARMQTNNHVPRPHTASTTSEAYGTGSKDKPS